MKEANAKEADEMTEPCPICMTPGVFEYSAQAEATVCTVCGTVLVVKRGRLRAATELDRFTPDVTEEIRQAKAEFDAKAEAEPFRRLNLAVFLEAVYALRSSTQVVPEVAPTDRGGFMQYMAGFDEEQIYDAEFIQNSYTDLCLDNDGLHNFAGALMLSAVWAVIGEISERQTNGFAVFESDDSPGGAGKNSIALAAVKERPGNRLTFCQMMFDRLELTLASLPPVDPLLRLAQAVHAEANFQVALCSASHAKDTAKLRKSWHYGAYIAMLAAQPVAGACFQNDYVALQIESATKAALRALRAQHPLLLNN